MSLLRRFIFIFFLLLLSSSLIRNLINYHDRMGFYEDYKQKLAEEEARNRSLKTAFVRKTDIAELEKTIRNKLNLLQPDEVAVIIPSPIPTPVISTPTPNPNWKQWMDVYFH